MEVDGGGKEPQFHTREQDEGLGVGPTEMGPGGGFGCSAKFWSHAGARFWT